ncbi:SsgA family sporulation/cell division regulator [Streptomyces sp. NRRL F-5727]|uniref:SsgA family sporulation/cell division regulator n=1 Tax=Streptomyces sp. NRRL F-5727 TaxID=1463871 RepID=UPI0004C480A5|nr:SsgA family sporulation/cell division regulator [Streptomyces sp. NRRL F-5727]
MKKCHLTLEITHWVTSELPLDLTCEFGYDTSDPLAVSLVLDSHGARPVRWFLCRELLADGLVARAGEGEVVLWPLLDSDGERSSFCVRVGGGDRTALFEIPVEPVARWLARTWEMVPRGTELEGVDWDELVQLAE